MGPCSAKDINTRKIDELIPEDNNGDIFRVMTEQLDEMTLTIQKQLNEMTRMMQFSNLVMHLHNNEHAARFQGGPVLLVFPPPTMLMLVLFYFLDCHLHLCCHPMIG